MNSLPLVSVIMPIQNEEGFIERSLGAVLAQDYPHDRLEVLIADGMSTDRTREIVAQCATASDVAVTVLGNPRRIVPTGFNAALHQAAGDFVVRVDGHTIIAEDYVRQCVAALQEEPEAANVGGRMNSVGKTAFGKAIAIATSSRFGVGGARFHYATERAWVDTVYLGAWRRDTFDKYGFFDEEFVRNQDDEFNYRVRAGGGKILLSPLIRSQYYSRGSPNKLWSQYYQYGYWKVRVLQKHPRQMRPRQFAPMLFIGALIASSSLAVVRLFGCWLLGSVLFAYVVMNLAFSLWESTRHGREHFMRLPPVYAIIHLSYGIGFLHGLIAFRNRWREQTNVE